MIPSPKPVELGDRWSFPLAGGECAASKPIRWEVILLLGTQAGAQLRVRLACEFELDGARFRVDEVSGHLVKSRLDGLTVLSAEALGSGELVVVLEGVRLVVPVDPNYEAWTASSPAGFKAVCLPGGGLAIWEP